MGVSANSSLPFLLLLLLAAEAAGEVTYSVDLDREEVRVNSSMVLSCGETGECPVNSWQLDWRLPDDAEILRVEDSIGRIEDYRRQGDVLKVDTNTGPRRTSETVRIEMKVEREARRLSQGLYQRKLSLPGLKGENTTGKVEAENFLSYSISPGFQASIRNNTLFFSGEGGTSLTLNTGQGYKGRYYTYFNQKLNGSMPYRIAVGTTGLRQDYPRIPVAVLDEEEYEAQAAVWSEGEYSAGVIRLRNSTERKAPVLAEETVHAFNDRALNYDRTSSSYLEEGIAGYVQYLVRKKQVGEARTRELFGNATEYTDKRNGTLYQVTKPSKGKADELWNYYSQNMTFMENWSPSDHRARDFGYAYSELVVKNYISRNNSLRELYTVLDGKILENNSEKWRYYSRHIDLTPCKKQTRKEFNSCLKRVNSYDYPVYYAEKIPEREKAEIRELPTPEPRNMSGLDGEKPENQGFFEAVRKLLADLITTLKHLQ
ncbi:MAG: hypothetical protein ABEJ95_07015 [Candidatus Nanohalobium sp.]